MAHSSKINAAPRINATPTCNYNCVCDIVMHRSAGNGDSKYAIASLQQNKGRIWFLSKGNEISANMNNRTHYDSD